MAGEISTPVEKKIALVTGGNKGIGLETCRQLASNGVMVILTARDEGRGKEAARKLNYSGLSDVVFHRLDTADASSIASVAEFVKASFGKLDILVNNAGISGVAVDYDALKSAKPSENKDSEDTHNGIPEWIRPYMVQTYEEAEKCLEINYYGAKNVSKAMIPLLLSSPSGTIVNVSSTLGQLRMMTNDKYKKELSDVDGLTEERLDEEANLFLKDFKDRTVLDGHGWMLPSMNVAYKFSKFLLNAYTRVLAERYPSLAINCVCPGYVKTDFTGNTGVLTAEEGAKGPVMLALGLHGDRPTGLFFSQTSLSAF